MTPKPADSDGAEVRLERALAVLIQRAADGTHRQAPTIAELCRLAHVSRNSVYRYYPGILAKLKHHRAPGHRDEPTRARTFSSPHVESTELHDQITKMAALVDHYYSAYREVRALLERRERELAELRRARSTNLAAVGR